MTEALTIKSNEFLAEFVSGDGMMLGFENFDVSQLKMPRFKLIQPTSKEGTPGKLQNRLTGEEFSTIGGTILGFVHKRCKWPEKFKRGDKPLCRSNDGIKSDDGKSCSTCPDAQWGEDGEKPACPGSIEFVGVTKEGDPFFIGASGMSVKPANSWLTWANLRRRPLLFWQVEIGTKAESNDQGNYFVLDIKTIRDGEGNILQNDISAMRDMKDMYEALITILKKSKGDLEDIEDQEGFVDVPTDGAGQAPAGNDPF